MLRTRMFSDSPGTPARSVQMPRTTPSIRTPASLAAYSASTIVDVGDRVALERDLALGAERRLVLDQVDQLTLAGRAARRAASR